MALAKIVRSSLVLAGLSILFSTETYSDSLCSPGLTGITLLGQSLIMSDVRISDPKTHRELREELLSSHPEVIFSDLEVAIENPEKGDDIRRGAPETHIAKSYVIDALKDLGINFLVSANNHAYDHGTGGILSTMKALVEKGYVPTGIGETIQGASAPQFIELSQSKAALGVVAAASSMGFDKFGGIADDKTPGINVLQFESKSSEWNRLQKQANLKSIHEASKRADLVIFYHHNHLSPPGIPDEWRSWAHQCIDAGADIYLSDGEPRIFKMEIYKGKPIFYGLGSFFFQTRKQPGSYPKESWRSVSAETCWDKNLSKLRLLRFRPIVLNEIGKGKPGEEIFHQTRGIPKFSKGIEGLSILKELQTLSEELHFKIAPDGSSAEVYLGDKGDLSSPEKPE